MANENPSPQQDRSETTPKPQSQGAPPAGGGQSGGQTGHGGSADTKYKLAERVHVYVNEHIRFADAKAGAILAASGILMSFPLAQFQEIAELIAAVRARGDPFLSCLGFAASMIAVCLFAAFLVAVFSCTKCLFGPFPEGS